MTKKISFLRLLCTALISIQFLAAPPAFAQVSCQKFLSTGVALEAQKLEAIEALEKMVRPQKESLEDVRNWLSRIQTRSQNGGALSFVEHNSLLYLLDREIFNDFPEPDIKRQVESLLEDSWYFRTKTRPQADSLVKPWPLRIRMKMTREERVFHQAIFENDGKISKPRGANRIELFVTILLTSLAFQKTGGDFVSGTIIGYFGATLIENFIHHHIGHATKNLKAITEKVPWVGKFVRRLSFSHGVVHHGLTYRDGYTNQFSGNATERQLIETLKARFGVDERDLAKLQNEKYGNSVSHRGVFAGLLTTLPMFGFVSQLMGMDLLSTFAMMAPTVGYVTLSHTLHPYLHLSRTEALEKASPLMRWFLRTSYVEWVNRHHWIHHHGGGGNYNLLHIGIGGDLLWGELRNPTVEQLLIMRKIEMIGATWDP